MTNPMLDEGPADGGELAVTWWGHATTTVEFDSARLVFDPVLSHRLAHLRRTGPLPGEQARRADVVLISHLHADHLHLPSLRRLPREATIVVPRGGERLLRRLGRDRVVPATSGDVLEVGDLRIEVLPARHGDGRAGFFGPRAQPVGFRVSTPHRSVWYPGDTGLTTEMHLVEPVDLAVVPVGGWGPTLGDLHLDPIRAATAVSRVGARWALPVHWGTFWPIGLEVLARRRHRELFVQPGPRFVAALIEAAPQTHALLAGHGARFAL